MGRFERYEKSYTAPLQGFKIMAQQFSLLKKRRFAPFFWTQFLGAFNDNVFKNALIILLTFNALSISTLSTETLVNLAGAVFILPFFFFSATSGQIADKVEKSRLIRYIKLLEILITVIIGIAFYFNSLSLLFISLFLFGAHSTLFGPVKYSIMPQHLKSYELIGGNGLVEMGTYVAILTGTIVGGLLVSIPVYGKPIVTAAMFLFAVSGWLFSRRIPRAPPAGKPVIIDWNVFRSTWRNLTFAREKKSIFLSVLGISWFWFYGTFMFYQAPIYAASYLGGNEHVATLVIACFSVGIGIGALCCEKLSHRTIEIGLVPLAAIGISIFTAELFYLQPHLSTVHNLGVHDLFLQPRRPVIVFDLIMLGVFGGLYTVPLYAFIQYRSPVEHRARIIATNNILNAVFMVVAAIFVIAMFHFGFTLPQLFLIVAIMNACVTLYIFFIIPEFIMRFCVWIIISFMYRLKVTGLEHLPDRGSVIYACNHVSFVDVLVMTAVCKRPIRFLMDHRLFDTPILNILSRMARAIPVASAKQNPRIKEKAFKDAVKALQDGDIIGIFPEGSITRDGKLQIFRKGVEEIIANVPAPVVPMALKGLWGSYFSRHRGKAMSGLPRRFWSRISLHIGKPIPAAEVTAERLQQAIQDLLDEREH